VPQEAKSSDVRRLEALLSALNDTQTLKKDPKGGCYCQAREHSLSTYTSICRNCGLILCEINQPNYACPHCLASLIPGNQRESLISRLQAQLDETIAKEIAARERAIEAARQQAGAFPTLSGAAPSATLAAPRPQVPQTRKVLSLDSKTKKVLVSSYTSTPASSRPASRSETEIEEERAAAVVRVPPPSAEVVFAKSRVDPIRPWANLRDGSPMYVAPHVAEVGSSSSSTRKGKQKKGKGKEAANL